jgi:RNA polymerase primary sigma factor
MFDQEQFDDLSQIRELIALGKEQGYLTAADINDHLPNEVSDPEQLDTVVNMLHDMGIQVFQSAEDVDPFLLENAAPAVVPNEIEAEGSAIIGTEDELGRTNDPVRMYMREMGTVDLLTRQGEIQIAKRIEEGTIQVLEAISDYPVVIEQFLNSYHNAAEEERLLSSILLGFTDEEDAITPIINIAEIVEGNETEEAGVAAGAEVTEDEEVASVVDVIDAELGPDPEKCAERFKILQDFYNKYDAEAKKDKADPKKVKAAHAQLKENFLTLSLIHI